MTQDRSRLMVHNWPTLKINSTSRASIHILSRAVLLFSCRCSRWCREEIPGGVGFVLQCHSDGEYTPPNVRPVWRQTHAPVTLYRTSKYGTGEGRHTRSRLNDSSPPNIFIRQKTRRTDGAGGGAGTSVSIRARVYGIRTFRGRRIRERAREKSVAGTTSQTENTHPWPRSRWTDGFWDASRSAGAK